MKFELKKNSRNLLKIWWLIITFSFMLNNLSSINLLYRQGWPKTLSITYNFFFKKNLKYTNRYKSLFSVKPSWSNGMVYGPNYLNTRPIYFYTKEKKLYDSRLLKLMGIYMRVNSSSFSKIITIHPGWSSFFYKNSTHSLGVLNVAKFYSILKRCYYLIFNLFYYNISILSFGNIFFSKEVNSINWNYVKPIRRIWRYVSPFLYIKTSKIFNYGMFIFRKIKVSNVNTAFVLDYFYHRKTFFYLNRCSFYTIALVPANCTPNISSYSIPSYSDGIFSQLFFIRFIIFIRKESDNYRFTCIKSSWDSLISSI